MKYSKLNKLKKRQSVRIRIKNQFKFLEILQINKYIKNPNNHPNYQNIMKEL